MSQPFRHATCPGSLLMNSQSAGRFRRPWRLFVARTVCGCALLLLVGDAAWAVKVVRVTVAGFARTSHQQRRHLRAAVRRHLLAVFFHRDRRSHGQPCSDARGLSVRWARWCVDADRRRPGNRWDSTQSSSQRCDGCGRGLLIGRLHDSRWRKDGERAVPVRRRDEHLRAAGASTDRSRRYGRRCVSRSLHLHDQWLARADQ